MQNYKTAIPYIIINILAFYLLPLLIKDTGSGMFVLIIAIPIICFIASLLYGIKNSLNLFYIVATVLLFVPTMFLYYNESTLIYVLLYGAIATLGNFLGSVSGHK